ncbi:kinase-like domain-containing protein [Lophiotrema nucula]|uniref:Kinase-like domain-containing protein n=1 Tax=Lophiotrema nucula TaxID=690887 RepID=A0A6A5YZ68_9PLEO|nr:kinase-like domain-containing protein [Lophiotrema nucula]
MASLHASQTVEAQNPRERLRTLCSVDYLQSVRTSRDIGYTNHEVAEVSILLETLNLRSWTECPRLYLTLSQAGLLQLRDVFISNRHTDAHFPYTAFSLPQGMAPNDRAAFLRAQSCVLASTEHVSQWDLGEHVRFSSKDQVPFEKEAILGSGGSGQVEVIVLRPHINITHTAFLTTLVRHAHLVEIIGSYTDPTYAALIMSPVADCDLTEFLRAATSDARKRSTTRTFFGCLAAALAYLHSKRIRHKDVKPSNILVQGSNVLITDFGLSRDCNDTRSTTEGPTGRTEKYCAPEVADYAPRNNSSDVWSLGCVYLEMLTVLEGLRLDQLAEFILEMGTGLRSYHANMVAVSLWLDKLHGTLIHESDNDLIPWIQAMVSEHRDSRPPAEVIASEIARARSVSGRIGEFCGICCRGEDERYIDVDMDDDNNLFVPESPLFEPESEDVKIIRSTEETPLPTFGSTAESFNLLLQPGSGVTMDMMQMDVRTEPTTCK